MGLQNLVGLSLDQITQAESLQSAARNWLKTNKSHLLDGK